VVAKGELKHISSTDITINPALGTGQLQIKDIHYVSLDVRDAWEFCQILDKKYLSCKKNTFEGWLELAKKYKWIKYD